MPQSSSPRGGDRIARWPYVALTLTVASLAHLAGAQEVITRGAAIGNSPVVRLAEAVRNVDAYANQTVILEGTVIKACQVKGCWMELVPQGESLGIRVTFKDYGFFVPTDSTGLAARLEGKFESNVFSSDDADHLIAEGVELTRNPDGTATELSFVAAGVEFRPAASGGQ
jgi:hypothetical protein